MGCGGCSSFDISWAVEIISIRGAAHYDVQKDKLSS